MVLSVSSNIFDAACSTPLHAVPETEVHCVAVRWFGRSASVSFRYSQGRSSSTHCISWTHWRSPTARACLIVRARDIDMVSGVLLVLLDEC